MTTDTLAEQRILTQIRQLSPEAIQKLEEFIDQLSQSSDSTEKPHPWLELAGMFKDDPFFDEFIEAMENYRKEVDTQTQEEYLLEETKAASH